MCLYKVSRAHARSHTRFYGTLSTKSIPFRHKRVNKGLHIFFSALCHFLCGVSVHHVGKIEKFFIEMIDGGSLGFCIGFPIHVQLRRLLRVIHRSSPAAAEGKSPGDTDGADNGHSRGALEMEHLLQRGHRLGELVYADAHRVRNGLRQRAAEAQGGAERSECAQSDENATPDDFPHQTICKKTLIRSAWGLFHGGFLRRFEF